MSDKLQLHIEAVRDRIEAAIEAGLVETVTDQCPPRLASAMRYAVQPGGARMRPRLCLAVADACGDSSPSTTDAAATAIEFLHCASLVHDDLPCFDDADVRRGKPSVHRAFGQRLAVLAGDALIVAGFQVLARRVMPSRLPALTEIVASSVGAPTGIAAGQAWECEPEVDLNHYHQCKTGALFAAATRAGAAAAGVEPMAWETLGQCIGDAYQVADDLRDVAGRVSELGKPTGQDRALGRPSAADQLGVGGAIRKLKGLIAEAVDSIPSCPGNVALRSLILAEAEQFVPKELRRAA